jgi:hypothetical protein
MGRRVPEVKGMRCREGSTKQTQAKQSLDIHALTQAKQHKHAQVIEAVHL